MRRVLDFCNRAIRRVNARFAVLIGLVALGGFGVWKGYGYWGPKKDGPARQIAIGVPTDTESAGVSTAAASLTDDQLTKSGGAHQLMAYGQPIESSPASASGGPTPPPTSPYLPTSSDPPGGYGTAGRSSFATKESPYGQSSPTSTPVTSPPSDPTSVQSKESSVPENPYRDAAGPTTPAPSPADLMPVADAASAYANRYSRGASSYGAAVSDTAEPQSSGGLSGETPQTTEAASTASVGAAPANPLPAPYSPASADLSAQSPRSITNSALESFATGSRLGSARSVPPSAALVSQGEATSASPTPGPRQIEGTQQPAITIEKSAPAEIQVGKPAVFQLVVRNAGQVPAHNVAVSDHVPAGTQLLDARPQPQQAADGSLVWSLGTMQPGDEAQITLQVMPQAEGEIGSTAHVTFAASATSRSICTRPQLAIEHTAPPKVLIGESLTVGITVSNPGTGPATGVAIEEDVPDGLSHLAGAQLEYDVGTLRPGESKRLELLLRAEKPGLVQNTILVHGDGNLSAKHTVQLEVVAPKLQIDVEGPKRRFLQRQATYTLQVANPGTAAAHDVELIAMLPRGMKFVAADSQGQYDPGQHAIFWSLAELPPAKAGAVKLTLLPTESGEQRLRIDGRGALGLTAGSEQVVQVDQAAELFHTVKDFDEVIEVGSETAYEIRVSNKGTKAATNVRVAAQMSAGMAAISGEGPTRAGGDATQVVFEPLARLNPGEEVIYKVQVQGKQPGDHIVRVQLSSDEWPTPVTREESTRVYEDR